ncbi:MAG: hypothetical protein QG597_1438, partial [Actinomycetota bacterium]|nr:hypothetical protein [Actinomycetota bacterium]
MRLSWRILAIAVATLSLWLGSAAWAVSSPVASSPDDDYHLAMIYCAGGKADCERGGARMRPCFAFSAAVTGDCTPPANIPLPTSPGDARRATFDLGTLTTPATYGIITGWYPPLYYEV